MKSKFIRNGLFSSVFVAMTITSMNAPTLIHAEDLFDEATLEYTEETGSIFKANYRQIYPASKFNTISTVTIPGSEYKSLISKNISNIDVYKGIPSNTLVSLTGLNTLEGTVEYTITSTLPLSGGDAASLVKCTGTAVNNFTAEWINADNGDHKGIRIIANIHWGKLIDSLPYLKEFQGAAFSPLSLDIEVSGLALASPQTLNNQASFTLTGGITKYTLRTPKNQNVKIAYEKTEKNDRNFPVVNKYKGETPIAEEEVSGFSKPSATIYIGEKNIPNNISNGSSSTRPNKPSADNSDDDRMIVLRLYNPSTGEHLFTTNAAERVQLVSIGWTNEYCEWDTPAKSDTPIYRLCNPNNDDHHYTTNPAEKDMLVQLGWRYEGSPFYSAEKGEGLPVYRLYNPNATGVGSHHYTSSKEERNALVGYGWNDEGIAWYGLLKED